MQTPGVVECVGDRAAGGGGADAVNADSVAVGGRRGRAEGDGVARHR